MKRSILIISGIFIYLILEMCCQAQAIEIFEKDNRIFISGSIKPGDQFKFKEFVSEHPTLKIVDLNSGGGFIKAAGQIGDQIRAKSLTTVIDAARSRCGSACTIIFAAGTNRIYLNGSNIKEGVGDMRNGRGLGYHEGNDFLANGKRGQSGAATGEMIEWLYSFGARNAVPLLSKADWQHLYYVPSNTAISLGLATSNNF